VLFLLLAATAFAAVDGTVVNQSTGRPEPGADVSVFNLSQNGPELLDSAKSDGNGHFSINQTLGPGPHLIEVQHSGVTYNTMVPPGRPSTGLELSVYDSSKDPTTAPVSQHIIFIEPSAQQIGVTDTYFFTNAGKVTYDNPTGGTVRFYVPPTAVKDSLKVNATEPRGMALEQAPTAEKVKGAYSISFPIKPGGETRIDIAYTLPAADPATFPGRFYYTSAPTRLVVPSGVTIDGNGVSPLGQEPQTEANLYEITAPAFEVSLHGTGTLRTGTSAPAADSDDSAPTIRTIIPPAFEDRRLAILALALSALALGFVLLYRRGQAAGQVAGRVAGQVAVQAAPAKGKSGA
jgi:hypothetical protein